MFLREKTAKGHTYLYLVETRREGGRVRQHIVHTLGRKDALRASGDLDRFAEAFARHSDRALLLSDLNAGRLACTRLGAPLLFGRLWEQTGCRAVIESLLAKRGFEFAVERAVFATVLHRLMVSGSDRACEKWLADYEIPGTDGLALHHLYRAMAWLGEELDALLGGQALATPFAPRCVKDAIEEALFARRRELSSELSVVFLDTTSLRFEGAGGETLGQRGHSKDHRPDLMQVILCAVIDAEGRPICSEIMPGNTADVSVLLAIADRLRGRFGIRQVCIVADRGLISEATIAGLEERGFEYLLGARERTDTLVRDVVLTDQRAFTPLLVTRAAGQETQLFAKEVQVGDRRYIVCRNEAEAEKDRADRQAIVAALGQQLQRGDKALIGNSAYRRYLRRVRASKGEDTDAPPAFEIDPGKLAEEAIYDGIFVLRTNSRLHPLLAMSRYRDLLAVEQLFRNAKCILRTRPIYHASDAAIRGHVFCSFLALVLQKELDRRCRAKGVTVEWADLIRDLDRLQAATIEQDGKRITLRSAVAGQVGQVFKAVGVALPPHTRVAA